MTIMPQSFAKEYKKIDYIIDECMEWVVKSRNNNAKKIEHKLNIHNVACQKFNVVNLLSKVYLRKNRKSITKDPVYQNILTLFDGYRDKAWEADLNGISAFEYAKVERSFRKELYHLIKILDLDIK